MPSPSCFQLFLHLFLLSLELLQSLLTLGENETKRLARQIGRMDDF